MTRPPKPRTLLWNALVVEVGVGEPLTDSERGRINSAVKELVKWGATPEDVRARAERYRELWPHIAMTARGLVANWSLLGPERRSAAEPEHDDDWAAGYTRTSADHPVYVPPPAPAGPPAWKPLIDDPCMDCGQKRPLAEWGKLLLCRVCWDKEQAA